MRRAALLSAACAATLAACATEDPGLTKDFFPQAAAKAACAWIFACCDTSEQKLFAGNATDEVSCTSNLTTTYLNLYATADPNAWDPKAARAVVDTIQAASAGKACPKAFDPGATLAAAQIVTATKIPGKSCTNQWECTTHFCKNGVCALLGDLNEPCASNDQCDQQKKLRCIQGTCQGLQPDGAKCATGNECISGACGGGQCVNSANYTCDGK
jgi:hypothetical protein